MSSSSDFRLPAGDTRSEADPGGGDSTPDVPDIAPRESERQPAQGPGSTVFNDKPPKPANSQPAIAEGTELGDFRIARPIGEGSMGEVYRATQISLDRPVALKILPKEFASNSTLLERFVRESKSLAALDHPHIVRVFATGEVDGTHYAALEFINGVSLQDILDQLKRLPVGDALHIALVCATALEHAHSRGIIHRDVKPSNVLVSRQGMAKVADFGLVKLVDTDMSMTATGTGLGTPEYMAPEQSFDARNVSPASDVFSLGAMLYVMLTGELPYKGTSVVEFLKAKQSGKYEPARSLNPEVPERLELILHKALVPDPKQRYESCAAFIRDLASLRRHNDSLSFVDHKHPYVAYGAWSSMATPAPSPASTGQTAAAAAGTTSARPAAAASATPDTGPAEPQAKMWYVAHKNKLGKSVLSKMMTDELILALERKLLPVSAQVKSAQNQPFRPLADHSEFHPVLTRLGVKVRRSPAAQQKRAARKQKRRRKKQTETADLVLRLVVGLCASYGLIRGLMDIGNLFR